MTNDKMFIMNDAAKNDPAVQMAIESYKQQLMREEQYRKDVRSGKIQPIPTKTWNISDRD